MQPVTKYWQYAQRDQIQYLAVQGIAAVTLVTARLLQPSANGFGTHQQLGLPPCPFLRLTGIPCPACGLTTSFAHTVRGHFYEAFFTQPFGLLACVLTAVSIPICFYLMYHRVAWMDLLTRRGANLALLLLLACWAMGWGYKIFIMR